MLGTLRCTLTTTRTWSPFLECTSSWRSWAMTSAMPGDDTFTFNFRRRWWMLSNPGCQSLTKRLPAKCLLTQWSTSWRILLRTLHASSIVRLMKTETIEEEWAVFKCVLQLCILAQGHFDRETLSLDFVLKTTQWARTHTLINKNLCHVGKLLTEMLHFIAVVWLSIISLLFQICWIISLLLFQICWIIWLLF